MTASEPTIDFHVAGSEPATLRAIASPYGTVSNFPERLGCDVVWWAQEEWWGVQRKELKDFIASVQGDRLSREIAQMRSMPLPLIVIEGRISYDLNGNLGLSGFGQNITRVQFRGMLWSVRHHGIHIDFTTSLPDTIEYVQTWARWTTKGRHDSLMRRPGPVSMWGKVTDRDYACHVLQGFDGIGLDKARAIVDHFGKLPLQWCDGIGEKELMAVAGIGRGTARKLLDALENIGEEGVV